MILSLTEFNLWANKRIIQYILTAGEEKADQELISSFSSIRKTLYHLWHAEVIWLTRLNGKSITSWPSRDFKGTLEEVCNGLLATSSGFVSFASQCNDFDQSIHYITTDKKSYTQSISQIIHHVVNHGSYHRGQLITMLRQTGFLELGSTDMIQYFREVTK